MIISQIPWHHNTDSFIIIIQTIFIIILSAVLYKKMSMRTIEIKLIQQQHVAKIDNIRREHSDTLEKIRVEMIKNEGEKNRQWIESEKETLFVLNGVSNLLDLSEKIGRVESEKILKKLDELQLKVENLTIKN